MSNDILTMPRKITLQDVFNAAWDAFVVKGNKPAVEGCYCSYRTKDGRKCAVGLMLTDEQIAEIGRYGEARGGDKSPPINDIVRDHSDWFDLSCGKNLDDAASKFRDAQRQLHDDALEFGTDEFKSKEELTSIYIEFANSNGLTVPVATTEST
jgi:hypothetical protein